MHDVTVYDVIVIGGGPAGVTASLRASELGARVALVEKAALGGICTHDGCAPTRVLAKTARLLREAQHFDQYGLVGARPALDFPKLLGRVSEVIASLHEKKRLPEHLERSGVSVYMKSGGARFVDPETVVLDDGTTLQGRRFILCAGGRPRRLTFPGSEYAMTHNDIWSLRALPPSIAIIGGAATGCQLASIFAQFGSRVTLLERNARLLRGDDPLISDTMAEAFQARGIELIFGSQRIDRIERVGDSLKLHVALEHGSRELDVDAVIMAVGWPGNADQLNVSAANVATERGYVVVDEYLRTTAPHIYAAGDINGRMMLVQSASHEGRIAAENAVLGPGQHYRHHIVPHGGFTEPEYAGVGLTEAEARAVEKDCLVSVVDYTDLDRAIIDERTLGSCKLIVSQESHRILGAHIVGEQALEAIQLVAASMAADMWVEQLAELELAYPTYTAIVGLAARRLVQALGVMPMASSWQALGKPYVAEWERSEV